MDDMHNSFDIHKNTIYKTMKAEYTYYVDKDFSKSIELLREAISMGKDSYRNYPVKSLKEICKKMDAISISDSIIKEYGISTDDSIL